MSANEVEFLGLEYAAKLTNKMGGNSDEVGSLMEKHWLGKSYKFEINWGFMQFFFSMITNSML